MYEQLINELEAMAMPETELLDYHKAIADEAADIITTLVCENERLRGEGEFKREHKYIDLSELKKFPIRKDHYDREHGSEDFVIGVESVLEYADSLPTVTPSVTSEWISVNDALPDVPGNDLRDITAIATDGKNVMALQYERAVVRGQKRFRWKWPWQRLYDGKPIIFWQPLPQPPKQEEIYNG